MVSEFSGKELENIKYKHCLYEKTNPVILANYVTNDNGTGLVHNAPGFGSEDYLACKAYGISVFCPIDEFGKFTKEVNDEQLVGIFYEKANDLIVERLYALNAVLKFSNIIHSVAID
ncbi:MAG: class I tRNA ligase family protein [Mycoplasmoidaceae bacterium]|nr:class I tRNA ligase family protein [Mycoplasmoidaceae bacterium]